MSVTEKQWTFKKKLENCSSFCVLNFYDEYKITKIWRSGIDIFRKVGRKAIIKWSL